MATRKTWAWLAAGIAVIGAGAFAQNGLTGDETGEPRPMVQLSPAVTSAAKPAASVAATATPASLTTTVGGYTYDWTALQAAIDADSEVANGYFIVGNAIDADYLFAYEKGSFGIDRVTPLASASKWFAGTLGMRMAQAGIVTLCPPSAPMAQI